MSSRLLAGVRPRPLWAAVSDFTNLAIFSACWLALLPRVFNGPAPSALAVIATVLAGIFVADAISGITHWFFDTFLEETTPIIGTMLVAPFREHHEVPEALTEHGLPELIGNTCMGFVPILGSVWCFGPVEPESTIGVCGYVFLLISSLLLTIANKFHSWAHASNAPRAAAWLQRLGLAISRERHARHHAWPHRSAYCVVNGWFDYVAEPIAFFEYAERLLITLGMPTKR